MSDVQAAIERYDTFPKILLRNAETMGDKTAYREKDLGIWQSWTWAETAENVRALTCGLAAMGLKRGDKIGIVGSNRPRLYWVFAAAQSLGAVPVPAYQDAVAEEIAYVLNHADARMVVCEDQEQVDKVMSVMEEVPTLEAIIYEDDRGMRHYDQSYLHYYDTVQEKGRAFDRDNPDFFLKEVAAGKGEDVAVMVYTSGTTGRPKGVMHSHRALIESARLAAEFEGLDASDEVLSYLPMAWIGDHFFSYAQHYIIGYTVNCPESADTVTADLKDIGPTYYFAPPAVFESILTQIHIRMEDAGKFKRWLFDTFMKVADRVGVDILEGRPVPLKDRLLYALGEILVYGPLKNNLGMTRIRRIFTGGAAMGPDVFKFFRSIGINLKQLYGQTECCAYACMQANGDVYADTVGPAAPGCEVLIDSETGEVMIKSPGTFVGYYKNEKSTKETVNDEGWIHTGDAGIIADNGHLKIIDRAKDVGRLRDGSLFAPQYIENKLKFFSYIREAVAHGHDRDYVTAFINIDINAVGNWAERNGIGYSGYTDLATRKEVYDLIQEAIESVNRDLATDADLAGSQIRRFLILHKELDADDGELTRTRKVRRVVINERYGNLIEALYSGADHVAVEAQVTFEDGRSGTIKADLSIRDVKTFESLRKAS